MHYLLIKNLVSVWLKGCDKNASRDVACQYLTYSYSNHKEWNYVAEAVAEFKNKGNYKCVGDDWRKGNKPAVPAKQITAYGTD